MKKYLKKKNEELMPPASHEMRKKKQGQYLLGSKKKSVLVHVNRNILAKKIMHEDLIYFKIFVNFVNFSCLIF